MSYYLALLVFKLWDSHMIFLSTNLTIQKHSMDKERFLSFQVDLVKLKDYLKND